MITASLRGFKMAPRKIRLIVDLIRNKEVNSALTILSLCSKKRGALNIKKLILSLLSNWNNKYHDNKSILYIKEIRVDQGKIIKRIRPVPQGKSHRIKKKLSHITICIDKKNYHGTKNKSNS
ncbi:50S ribosomal protein L22 [Blattabacterium cuenoti]|uniref:50S ribosomal protein L22 n=1 Tax=Blattabacterium cuenoti TaxID=1653831 RepID=UPI00163C3D5C|nr:50S ribosomal protein L22 [Blattabacterium cuenoti]